MPLSESILLPLRAPEIPLPLLVTGVAGVAGYNAFGFFRDKCPGRVIGTRRSDNWPLRGAGIVPCDVDDRDGMRRLFDEHEFAAVLNCEGTCKLKSCELDPSMAARINTQALTTDAPALLIACGLALRSFDAP